MRDFGGSLILVTLTWWLAATVTWSAPGPSDTRTLDPAAKPARAVARSGAPDGLALVLSGGVSLGSYEAGFLYYLTEAVRNNPEALELSVLTGTSAGSINAILTAVSYCSVRGAVRDPRESLFYRAWLPIGFEELFVAEEASAIGAFTRSAFEREAAELGKLYRLGFRPGCDLLLGFTATRVTPARTDVGALNEIAHSEVRFSVAIDSLGPGQQPRIESYLLPDHPLPQPVLPLDGPLADPYRSLLQVVFASAAFPLAFEPMPVEFCTASSPAQAGPASKVGARPCTSFDASPVPLVDGALFDNTPLRLAVELAEAQAEATPVAGARAHAHSHAGTGTRFGLLPSDGMPWPRPYEMAMADPAASGTIDLLTQLTSGFVETARQAELRVVVDEHPEIVDRMTIFRGVLPSHGDLLWAFGGFFERGFREADFVQGMAAAHLVAPKLGLRELTSGKSGWLGFDCVIGVLTDDAERAEACRHPEVRPLRPLFQVALDRLYAECWHLRQSGRDPESMRDPRCRRAMEGGRPPLVPGQPYPADPEWRKRDDEDWFGHQLRRLYAHRFVWEDSDLGVAKPAVARRYLRDRIAEPALWLARRNEAGGALVRLASEIALNQVAYGAPQRLAYLGLGAQLEVGLSYRLRRGLGEWVRVGGVLAVDGIYSPLRRGAVFGAITPALDLQLEPLPLSTAILQPRFGIQLGYRLSTADGLGRRDCTGPGQICTQPALRLQAGVSVLQRMRLQMGLGLFARTQRHAPSLQLLPLVAITLPNAD